MSSPIGSCTTSCEAAPKASQTLSGNSITFTPPDCRRCSAAALLAMNCDIVQMLVACAALLTIALWAGVRLS